jgi:hypothetical protein
MADGEHYAARRISSSTSLLTCSCGSFDRRIKSCRGADSRHTSSVLPHVASGAAARPSLPPPRFGEIILRVRRPPATYRHPPSEVVYCSARLNLQHLSVFHCCPQARNSSLNLLTNHGAYEFLCLNNGSLIVVLLMHALLSKQSADAL